MSSSALPFRTSRHSEGLASQGFKVHSVSADRMVIEFSGNAGLVRYAFHTPLHRFSVNGVKHFANMHDPDSGRPGSGGIRHCKAERLYAPRPQPTSRLAS